MNIIYSLHASNNLSADISFTSMAEGRANIVCTYQIIATLVLIRHPTSINAFQRPVEFSHL